MKKALLIPLAVFLALVVILGIGFTLEDPHYLPSEMIDRPFPAFALPELHDAERTVTPNDLDGQVALVNVWATWCANCLIEHPELMRIKAEEGIPIYGINYKDDAENAGDFLAELGDFYTAVGTDDGPAARDWGVYGVPETFVVDGEGRIVARMAGPVTQRAIIQRLQPALDEAASR